MGAGKEHRFYFYLIIGVTVAMKCFSQGYVLAFWCDQPSVQVGQSGTSVGLRNVRISTEASELSPSV